MATFKKTFQKIKYPDAPDYCPVCRRGEVVDWKNTLLLQLFISDRGKILPRTRSGVCAKHQRKLAEHIKRARIAALLPFVEH